MLGKYTATDVESLRVALSDRSQDLRQLLTHLCFAIALVDQLDAETREVIQTVNPIDRRVDILLYEVSVFYGLSNNQLYYYS